MIDTEFAVHNDWTYEYIKKISIDRVRDLEGVYKCAK